MNKSQIKAEKRARRHKRIRAKIAGTKDMPRFSVFKSNKFIYAQLIDDTSGKTLASFSSFQLKGKGKKTEQSKEVGKGLAKIALEQKIKKVVFDRGGFLYTGRVKALADGAREGGLIF